MVKLITATEAMTIYQALKEAKKTLAELGVDDYDLEDLNYALEILKGLKEKNIEDVIK